MCLNKKVISLREKTCSSFFEKVNTFAMGRHCQLPGKRGFPFLNIGRTIVCFSFSGKCLTIMKNFLPQKGDLKDDWYNGE
jgi:hypothetical protein